MERRDRSHANMEPTDAVDTKQSKQRASIKWLLSKAYNNRVPENLQEPFYRDHEDQEHLKPPIVGRLANAELYCLALANMYSDPNYHSLNHWNILTTLSRKGVPVPDPQDCALTETVLIQTNPLKLSGHMSVIEALMMLYAREVVTLDRVSAAAQRFGTSQPLHVGSSIPHEDGLICWINAACSALNKAEENSSNHVPIVKNLEDICDGTALAALIAFYCPDALPRATVRVGRVASLQDCLHNLMLVYEFCHSYLPHNVFHMMPEDVTYMRGSMRQNLIAMLADLFNMLEVHPVKCVKYPVPAVGDCNAFGVRHKRCLPPPPPVPIPDLRPEDIDRHAQPFQVPRSPSACAVRPRAPAGRSACSTPERRSCSPQREDFVVHRSRGITTLSSLARRDDDNVSVDANKTPAGRPSNWGDSKDSFAGRRSRRSSITDDSQLTVENFGGSQDRLHFAGRNPEKELATLASARKISAPAGPAEPNPPVRSSKQDIRGSIQSFFHGDVQNGSSQDERTHKVERQNSQDYYPMKRQLSSDTISLKGLNKAGGDGGFYLSRDAPDGEMGSKMTFADMNKMRSNGDQAGVQLSYRDIEDSEVVRKSTCSTPNTTTWQQQYLQQPHNGDGDRLSVEESNAIASGQATAAQLHNVRMKLEEKRRRMEQDKRKMELAITRQRQQLGQQAFLQAVTRDTYLQMQLASLGKRAATDDGQASEHDAEIVMADAKDMTPEVMDHNMSGRRSPEIDQAALEQYQQSIAKMNSSIQDIQSDIARLASQQNQLQNHHQSPNVFQSPKPMYSQSPQPPTSPYQPPPTSPYQPSYQPNIPQLHNQFSSQHNVSSPRPAGGLHGSGFGSSPHIPREMQHRYYHEPQQNYHEPQQNYHEPQPNYHEPQPNYHEPQPNYHEPQPNYHEQYGQGERQFYLHEHPPTPQRRRTWAQHAQMTQHNENTELRGWQFNRQNHQYPPPQQTHEPPQPQMSWKSPSPQPQAHETRTWNPQSFVLHDRTNHQFYTDRIQNGTDRDQNHLSYTVINPSPAQQYSQSPPLTASPRRSKTPQRQGSLPEAPRRSALVSLQQLHTPPASSHESDTEPQGITCIGNAENDALRQGINRLNISSGTRTYRIPSPTRPSLSRNSFHHLHDNESSESNEPAEKGFYISFDNEQPKRPKPPLRTKRGSPKKDRTPIENRSPERKMSSDPVWSNVELEDEKAFVVHVNLPMESAVRSNDVSVRRETPPREKPNTRVSHVEPAALVIGELTPDPNSAEEMERKKERIMLLSLQRRQRAEEARARAEQAAAARRARDESEAEQKAARKEEQAKRREAILAQYKLKKAIEEAEREGKVFDKSEFMEAFKISAPSVPSAPSTRMRSRPTAARARPKTIHVDSSTIHAAEGMLTSKQPSSTNLTGGTMRRDYYRGSQDSLAERAGLYRESPVDDRGAMSPSSGSGSGPLGRRGSCKTSRERVNDADPPANRGRSRYQNNFKSGRKSSSLMNLCDSGLGRATPPRRAASPGARTLHSPASGPGSLPGGIGKRRVDRTDRGDDNSDVSSTHSSILDYSGPRLYKQPATKSNRGIMQNAVEYCVFPGAVNAEAKRRVLEEMARSDSKHFLVLFRDAGCQFRALYTFCPETERVDKLYGTGPKHVNDRMFDKFFKYNSGSKSFSQIHTKHLTVTIDAFTIHNSLWQGKKVQLPSKKDMALVI